MPNDYYLAALISGMMDPRTEQARKLINLTPRYPIVTLDSLESVYPKPPSGRPFTKEALNKYRNITEGLQLKGTPAIYINRGARPYKENDIPFLSSVLAHENEHALGGDEDKAYDKQASVLNSLGYKKDNPNYTRVTDRLAAMRSFK